MRFNKSNERILPFALPLSALAAIFFTINAYATDVSPGYASLRCEATYTSAEGKVQRGLEKEVTVPELPSDGSGPIIGLEGNDDQVLLKSEFVRARFGERLSLYVTLRSTGHTVHVQSELSPQG